MEKYFNKVLIANRGEIALRIIRTLKKMNITSVAIYSEADRNALHVQHADETYYVGHSPAIESYLSIENIIEAAKMSDADAIHPGYGFLSENYEFADALEKHDIALIGPHKNAIKVMGDKIEAKKIAKDSGLSIVPGFMGTLKNSDEAISMAKSIGFPVIVKAVGGGGGRGMRVVENIEQMKVAYDSARYEAASAFNDGRLFIEKFMTKPRHIEVQVIADMHGNVVCLGERECTIQRYHQKIIEEAPSSFITQSVRQELYNQARLLCKNVGYYSAGTVEFIMDQKMNFYFLEMNTRLQVEHPVTELVTGFDIVEEMIKIAARKKLSFSQKDVKLNGFAIESRIYSEDPSKGFLPSTGRIIEYKEPPKNSNIRIDTGVDAGSEISMFYDSMIAKLCVYDQNSRANAIERMKLALGQFIISGISSNISFLEAIIGNKRFVENDINTNFINEEYPDGFSGVTLTSETVEAFIACGMHVFMEEQKRKLNIQGQIIDQSQSSSINTRWLVKIDDMSFLVLIKEVEDGYNIRQGSNKIYTRAKYKLHNKLYTATLNGRKINVQIKKNKSSYLLTNSGVTAKVSIKSIRVSELEGVLHRQAKEDFQDQITAPINGIITRVRVSVGDKISKGQELFVISAMKMENTIFSEQNAVVSGICVKDGSAVSNGEVLIEFSEL